MPTNTNSDTITAEAKIKFQTGYPANVPMFFTGTLNHIVIGGPFRSRQGTFKMNPNLSAGQKKDTTRINEAIEFCTSEDESSYVVLVASSKDGMNDIRRIDNKGKIVGSFVYDRVRDQYQILAAAIHKVGVIPISYLMRLKDHPTWYTYVPMPETVIFEHLSSRQKHGIETFKEKMGDTCSYHYVHFTGYF